MGRGSNSHPRSAPIPQDAHKYILTKNCDIFFIFLPITLLGVLKAAIQGSGVPPKRMPPPRQIPGYAYANATIVQCINC